MTPYTVLGWLAPPLVALALWGYVRRRRRVARALGDAGVVARLPGGELLGVPWTRLALVLVAALALGLALADPRWGGGTQATAGGSVVLVLDASNSMLVRDVAPNRLEQARDGVRRLARALGGTPVGVVVFAGRAYTLSPPTPDRGAVELFLDALDPQIVSQTGSSLSAAIRQGATLLRAAGEEGASRTLVLVSDGDALEERPQVIAAARDAARAGVTIHVLGAGTAAGGPVPDLDPATGRATGYKREPGGEVAVSRLGEELLRAVADATRGEYAPLSDPEALPRLLGRLETLRPGGADTGGGPPPRYAWFVGLAALLLLAEAVVAHRPREVAA